MSNNGRRKYEKSSKIIKMLNKNGFNITPLQSWVDFLKESLPELDEKNIKNIRDDYSSNIIKKEDLKRLQKEYLEKITDNINEILKNLDIEKATNVIVKEQAKEHFRKNGFVVNGFVQYINRRVFEIDMSAPLEVIMYKLIFEWYDLSQEKRNVYRKLASLKLKDINREFNTFKRNQLELDCSDFDELEEE